MSPSEALDKIIILLVSGASPDRAEHACVEKLGMGLADAKATVVEAQRRIEIAANFDKQKEIGRAIVRLNDLYASALRGEKSDLRTALLAQKEINRLLRLYESRDPDALDAETNAVSPLADELAAIRAHLIPLNLALDTYPLREHARIAADLVRRMQSSAKET